MGETAIEYTEPGAGAIWEAIDADRARLDALEARVAALEGPVTLSEGDVEAIADAIADAVEVRASRT